MIRTVPRMTPPPPCAEGGCSSIATVWLVLPNGDATLAGHYCQAHGDAAVRRLSDAGMPGWTVAPLLPRI